MMELIFSTNLWIFLLCFIIFMIILINYNIRSAKKNPLKDMTIDEATEITQHFSANLFYGIIDSEIRYKYDKNDIEKAIYCVVNHLTEKNSLKEEYKQEFVSLLQCLEKVQSQEMFEQIQRIFSKPVGERSQEESDELMDYMLEYGKKSQQILFDFYAGKRKYVKNKNA